jgi:thioredoxin reductase (NADPH)
MCAKKIEMEEQAAARRHSATRFDVLVIGAGPTGLACAIETSRRGMRSVLVDKGCLCNSLFHYPANMTFFTTP